MHEVSSKLGALPLSLVVAFLCGCAAIANNPTLGIVDREQGLEISRNAAKSYGFDLTHYRLDTFGDPEAVEGKWLFVYLCSPGPPPPGCSFMVSVDKQTGDANVQPGQ